MPETVRNLLPAFLDYLTYEKRYSAHTVRSYSTDLLQLDDFLQATFGNMGAGELNVSILRSWLAGQKQAGMDARSINRKISATRSFYRFHLRKGSLAVNPASALRVMKTGKRLPSFLKEEQAKDVTAAGASPDTWKGATDQLIMEILYNTGLRVSELVSLKEKHVDSRLGHIKVLGKGNKERIIPLKKEMLDALTAYRAAKRSEFEKFETEFLLVNDKGRKLNTQYVYRSVRSGLKNCNTVSKKSPHVMRHSFATHLSNNGADLNAIKELLGHASLAATQVYTHTTIEKLKEVYRQAHPKA